MAEVTTHICGVSYGSNEDTINKIKDKHKRQEEYAKKNLDEFKNIIYMFWSPVVPKGKLTEQLMKIESLQLIINEEYIKRIIELINYTKDKKENMSNDFIRILQILHSLKGNNIFA
jgi:hypothetical protein